MIGGMMHRHTGTMQQESSSHTLDASRVNRQPSMMRRASSPRHDASSIIVNHAVHHCHPSMMRQASSAYGRDASCVIVTQDDATRIIVTQA